MTVCSSVQTLREATTVHVISISKRTPLTGGNVQVSVIIKLFVIPQIRLEYIT